MSKFRVSMSERNGELKGTVEFPEENLMALECLAAVIEQFAKRTGNTLEETVQHLYAVAARRVK